MQTFTLPAGDGYPLAVRRFEPATPTRQHLIIAPAMGVPQQFYQHFAHWLAGCGLRITTFDYRGIGASAPATLRGFHATITDWATRDAEAVLRRVLDSGDSVIWLGHSLGGQILGMIPSAGQLRAAIMMASGSGYWRYVTSRRKPLALLLWFGIAPIASRLAGYYPGKKLGIVADVPRAAMQQWRRWCLHPEYLFGVESPAVQHNYRRLAFSLHSYSFADDEMMTAAAIDAIHPYFPGVTLTEFRWSGSRHGLASIGHFGFFKRGRETLWEAFARTSLATLFDS